MKTFNYYFLATIFLLLFSLGQNANATDKQRSATILKGTTAVGDTVGAFNAGNLTPTPDRALLGIVFIDGHYYISGADPDAGWQRKIYQISGDGQELVNYWALPDSVILLKGLAYDGVYMYAAGNEFIYQIAFETMELTGVVIPAPIYYASGLAYDPATDHFWVSGDGSQIYEIDRNGNVINIISFITDLPTAGLAWDTWSIGGPYLWVWSMKYTPTDVRPKAYQIKASTGQYTGVSFEGVIMSPYGIDQALSLTLSDQIIDGKVTFAALHGSNFQTISDGLDWVVLYDLDPDGTGIPGPIVNVNPTFIQNNLFFNDSIEIEVTISNLSDQFNLNWLATLEYPENEQNPPGDVLLDFDGTELVAPVTDNALRSVVFLNDHIYIATRPGTGNNAQLIKITPDGSAVVASTSIGWSNFGGTALASDGTYLYASATYWIQKFDPETLEVLEIIPNTNFSVSAMAFDAQNELLYLAGGSSVRTIDKQGQQVNFYVSQFNVRGLAWDNWSPGGPFLWVYAAGENGPAAYRTHPSTGIQTGVVFEGINFGSNDSIADVAGDIFVTPDWQQNTLAMIALQKSTDSDGQLSDRVVVYDLATVPPPGWIDLTGTTVGSVEPLSTNTLTVKLKAIMQDTLMTANVVINNNSIVNSKLAIPVIFVMEPDNTVGINQKENATAGIISKLYPNPVKEVLNLQVDNSTTGSLIIFDLMGVKVYEEKLNDASDNYSVNIKGLPKGIYQVVVANDSGVDHRSFIIQ
jgi:hypothetical protein